MGSPNRLNTQQASEWLGLPEATLRWYRHRGDRGPRSYCLGSRIFYDLGDLEQWETGAEGCNGQVAVCSDRTEQRSRGPRGSRARWPGGQS